MPRHITEPVIIPAAGGKRIEEFAGSASTGGESVSVARMKAPPGWSEPGQRPEFQETTLVLSGRLMVEFSGGRFEVTAGQAVVAEPGQWVRYGCPGDEGAEYIAICVPAFTPDTVHRDPDAE